MIPARYTNLTEARRFHGSHVDKLAPYLLRTDPLADNVVELFARLPPGKGRKLLDLALDKGIAAVPEAPPPLQRLFQHIDDVPFWVDWNQLDLGGASHRRCGVTGGVVLACCSLPLIYSSPAGNKPLVFSGRLVQRASRRLSETARFVVETCLPGGLQRFSMGLKITVKVRLMHAQIRRLLQQSGRWDTSAWGAPINQVDMASTNLLFSVGLLDWLRRVGFHFSSVEGECVMHLWRYSGYLLGIDPDLLCATEAEGRHLARLLAMTQHPPDQDSRELARAIMETAIPKIVRPEIEGADGKNGGWLVGFCYGLSYGLIGRKLASELGYPRTIWRFLARPLTRVVIGPAELCRRLVPGIHRLILALGTRRIRRRMEASPVVQKADFQVAERLGVSADNP
jgi:hypothetical protein